MKAHQTVWFYLIALLLLVACGGTPAVEEPTAVADSADPTAAPEEVAAEPTAVPEQAPSPTTNLTDGCVTDFDPSLDYFPDKTTVEASNGFSVEYFNHYKLVTVNQPFPFAEETATYLLVQCGTPIPDGYPEAVVVEIPIDSIVALSTTYLPALVELGVVDTLVGIDSTLYTSTPEVLAKIESGELAEVGFGGDVNVEVAIDLEPDVVMTYASGTPDYDAHPKLEEAGLTPVLNADYLDNSPLGRAEWAKFIALFYNAEAAAESWFDGLSSRYAELIALTAAVETRPTVFTNVPFEDTWYVPGGQSYAAQLLADAGATYIWAADESNSSLFLDFEAVYDAASEADYWLTVGAANSLADLASIDERYAEFAAFANGTVYNDDLRVNDNFGNDIYESGVVNPDQVLADLIAIFHPELLPEHQFTYYRPLPAE